MRQKTIAREFSIIGIGLHTGKRAKGSFQPAPGNHGIKFRRTDLSGEILIDALAENVVDTARTTISVNGISVSTVEHVLAAILALGIDNLLIEINAGEVPILDGSALEFVKGIKAAGTINLKEERNFYTIKEDITYIDPEKGIIISGSPLEGNVQFTCEIDYNSQILGVQRTASYRLSDFEAEIASSRTFVFLHEMQMLIRHNLIKGGGFDNAIVIVDKEISPEELKQLASYFNRRDITIAPQGILNNTSLRYPDEPADIN